MEWLALHCHGLPLTVFAEAPSPAVVVERAQGREQVIAADARAREAGIRPPMALAAARIRCPGLAALARDRTAEIAVLEQLAERALCVTDHVAVEPPLDLLLEIGRSRDYFGGHAAVLGAVDRLLTRAGYVAWQGVAPTPAAARVLAHAGGGEAEDREALERALADVPVALAAPDAATARRLQGWGVHSLGACLALPRAGLARRLGPAMLTALERITGQRRETVARFTPAQVFRARLALAGETASLECVLAAVEALCRRLAQWLRERDAAIQGFTLWLHALRGEATAVTVGLAVPGRDAAHLRALAGERLERTGLAAPVVAVTLVSERPAEHRPRPGDLWADADREPGEYLLERLRARLGRDAVAGLTLRADHRPERAWDWHEPGQIPVHEPPAMPARPLWLLTRPAELATGAGERPLLAGPVELLGGPERIETGWWDGDRVERDYFVARSRLGLVLWLYRERRPPRRWFVHGLFG